MMILATDLDGTFLAGSESNRYKLYNMIRERSDIKLIFVTGRGVESVMPLLGDALIPDPDYMICDVGATVLNGKTLQPVQPLQAEIDEKWPGQIIFRELLSDVKGLTFQEAAPQQRRCSFFYEEGTNLQQVYERVAPYECDILLSAGRFLDILPKLVNKGSTLHKLASLEELPKDEILVAGDTLNDLSLFEAGFKGVVVGGAENSLIAKTSGLPQIYHARETGTGGILESLNYFNDFAMFHPNQTGKMVDRNKGETKLLMAYHRLPYDVREEGGMIKHTRVSSPNGIIPTLLSFFAGGRSGAWIAWEENNDKKTTQLENQFIDRLKYPNLVASRIPLSRKDIELFYKLFSKEAFWPTIFSFIDRAKFNHDHWEHFNNVNRRFAEKLADEADENAIVWIHDYNLWMVPGHLRIQRPDVTIGFFHHTAFPPADIFNIIPWRREIIGSLLQCDYIGFHIPRYVENFVDVVRSHTPVRVIEELDCAAKFLTYSCALGLDKMAGEIDTGQRRIRLGAHPVGIDLKNIHRIFNQPNNRKAIEEMKSKTTGKKIILSIERLDYVKGPLEKIRAFAEFLERHPEFHGEVELINICTPPATGMKVYEKIESDLEQAIGRINGRFSRLDWVPVRFFFRSFPFEEVIRFYAIADVAWITPLRDGLNLVAKEYVAVQGLREKPDGVLILSEFAGASVELKYALLTNPYDSESMQQVLLQALTQEENERLINMRRLYEIVSYYDIDTWGREFMHELEKTGNRHREDQEKEIVAYET